MPLAPAFYVYPMSRWVSFSYIAEHHVRELRRHLRVEVVDEGALAAVMAVALRAARCVFLLHPFFYPMQVYEARLLRKLGRPERVIGVDVADSDHVSAEGVRLTGYAEAMVVPSTFSRDAYVRSGVSVPVHVVPHGVPEPYLSSPPSRPSRFRELADYKARSGRRLLQVWLLHSGFRKGEDLAYEVFNRLLRERGDVALAVRRPFALEVYSEEVDAGRLRPTLSIPAGRLSEGEVMELMDACDAYLLSSRGGGFEHPPLLALARGEPVVAARGGAWQDYLPSWGLVESRRSSVLLPGNPIHDGCGVEMEVEAAVGRLHEVLDDLEGHRAKVREHVESRIREGFTWRRAGELLRDVVLRYL